MVDYGGYGVASKSKVGWGWLAWVRRGGDTCGGAEIHAEGGGGHFCGPLPPPPLLSIFGDTAGCELGDFTDQRLAESQSKQTGPPLSQVVCFPRSGVIEQRELWSADPH